MSSFVIALAREASGAVVTARNFPRWALIEAIGAVETASKRPGAEATLATETTICAKDLARDFDRSAAETIAINSVRDMALFAVAVPELDALSNFVGRRDKDAAEATVTAAMTATA
jgi:hypothetical protein